MSFVSEKATIEQYVQANYASTLVKYENDEMNDSSVNEWIRVSTQDADGFQVDSIVCRESFESATASRTTKYLESTTVS